MALHMIKLVVGVDEVAELADYIRQQGNRSTVHTRQTPKRAEELLQGGSIYRVIKGQILLRQTILAIETLGVKGMTRCEIELDPHMILTAPQPRRAFQGWRYFTEEDAPPDLEMAGEGAMPADLAAQLRTLGAW
jgi:hypothetical protein